MKTTVILSSLLLFISSLSYSQDTEFEYYKDKEIKTLLGRNRSGGGYGAFSMGYSVIDDENAVLFGGRFGWLANRSVGVGIGATGFINELHYEPSIDMDVFLTGGYGGIYIEPILMPRYPIHMSFPILFGAGGISYISKEPNVNDNLIEDSDAFLIIEPGAEIELNLTRFFRLAVGTTYRFPTSFNIGSSNNNEIDAKSIEGFSYMVTFKFGKF